ANAIFFPSGDHAGQPSKNGVFVTLRGFEPSPSATKTSEFSSPMILRNAIFFISGHHEPYVLNPAVIRGVIFGSEIGCVDVRGIFLRRLQVVIRTVDDTFAVSRPVWMDRILLPRCKHFNVAAISSHNRNTVSVRGDEDERDLGPK